MLTVIGDLVEDVVVWVDAAVRRGTDNAASVRRTRGGSAANVAAFAGRAVTTRFVGRVGDDALADVLVGELTAAGVQALVQRAGRTGTVVVLVDHTGERTMFPDRAAAGELGPIDAGWLAGTTVVHLPWYGLIASASAAAVIAAAARVREGGGAVSIDLSSASVLEDHGRERCAELLDQLAPSIVFANADEAAVFTAWELAPPASALMVVKDGPRPVRITGGGLVSPLIVEAEPVAEVHDTTGAGDAFAAGFLSAWATGAEPAAAALTGHRFAAAVLGSPGASIRPVPTDG